MIISLSESAMKGASDGFFRVAFYKTGEAWLMKQSTTHALMRFRPNKILVGSPWLSQTQSKVILHCIDICLVYIIVDSPN